MNAAPVTSLADLRTRYRSPSERAATKVVQHVDEASARFISHSTLVMLSTSSPDGRCDVSPRGGPAGFVAVLDDRHVALPDLNGNNRLDSYSNIVENPWAGLLFIVAGKDETLRVNGPARLTDDPAVLDRFTTELRRPKLAVVVETEELYAHCAKAFRRSGVWDPTTWAAHADAPDLPEIYAAQKPDRFQADELRSALAEGYETSLAEDRPEE